jgi:hypothetical protein
MAVTTVIATVCVASIAFNVRFLVALCVERRALLNEKAVRKHRGEQKQVARTA